MGTNNEESMETRLSKAVPKAFKQLLKNIESEPTLVVEPGDGGSSVSKETLDDIRAWLFKRR